MEKIKKGMDLANVNVNFEHKPQAGITVATVFSKENASLIGKARAVCSENDNFSKEVGRKLSLKRALKESGLSKEERSKIWEAYRTYLPISSTGLRRVRWGS